MACDLTDTHLYFSDNIKQSCVHCCRGATAEVSETIPNQALPCADFVVS